MKRLFLVITVGLLGLVNCWASGPLVPLSDQLTVFSPTLSIVGQVSVFEDGSFAGLHSACNGPTCGTSEDSANIYYIDLGGLAVSTAENTMLLESDTVGSDVFGTINLGLGTNNLFFESDNETVEFLPVAGYILQTEGDGFADATPYLTTDLRASGYTAQFFSDPEVAPEPATTVLLGCGLVALGWRRHRRPR